MPTALLETLAPGIAQWTLNRPERRNALDLACLAECEQILSRLESDASVQVVVLTGAGEAFCAGFDLKEAARFAPAQGAGAVAVLDVQERLSALIERVTRLRQPVGAAIRGAASGGGLGLALAADIRVAGRSARFQVANAKLGLSAGDCGLTWLMPRLIGLSRSFELLLTGRPFDAEEADRIGLLSRLVDDDRVQAAALEIASSLVALGPLGPRMSKQVIYANLSAPDLRTAAIIETRAQVVCGAAAALKL